MTKSLPLAEFKLPPPSRERKLTVEFPGGYGSADAKSHELWLEVDRLWVPASRERQEVMHVPSRRHC